MAEKQKVKKEEVKKDKEKKPALNEFGDNVEKFAVKTAESIRKVIDRALSSRNTVLTIRVNDECNKKLNMLVEAGLFRSRSESAAFLIEEGLKTQDPLFAKISTKFEKIDLLKTELKKLVKDELVKTPKK
ncbi:MAG: hypothetical protein KAX11_07705 [Candidatus Aminicenantes bacterium]|nr:hypothetical protein [Candidatus Aminicenantes bacterium]